VDDLDRLKAGIGDAVEEPLTGAEQDVLLIAARAVNILS
jgi:hypothetical protein